MPFEKQLHIHQIFLCALLRWVDAPLQRGARLFLRNNILYIIVKKWENIGIFQVHSCASNCHYKDGWKAG